MLLVIGLGSTPGQTGIWQCRDSLLSIAVCGAMLLMYGL
jgi:hypothetical protein